MVLQKRFAVAIAFLLGISLARAQSPPDRKEDHKPAILGIRVGMTAQNVLDRLGRMPDTRKDEKNEVIVSWRLADASVLQVNFRKEHIWHIALRLKNPRPSTDLWLQPLAKAGTPVGLYREERAAADRVGLPVGRGENVTPLTAPDPRLERAYKASETRDKLRTVWSRQAQTEDGYRVEIQFLSASRAQFGDRFEEFVEFKYVSVARDDLKKFDRVTKAWPQR